MSRARTQWRILTPLAFDLLRELRLTLSQHPVTSTWTAAQGTDALKLLDLLQQAWAQERIDLDALSGVERMTGQLNMTSTVTCRAALEGLHSLYRRVAEVTYEELSQGEPHALGLPAPPAARSCVD